MKRLMTALALSCVLSTTSLAGDIPSVGIAPPPPPPDGATSTTSPGEVPTVGYTQQISDAALNLIQLMLGAGI